MTERETPDDEPDDGLDAWLAAHFPPKSAETGQEDARPEPPPPVDDGLPGAPAPTEPIGQGEGPPTAAWPALPPELPPVPPVVDAALPGIPDTPTEVFGAVEDASILDDIFGETNFREYGSGPDPAESPFAARSVAAETVAIDTNDAPAKRLPAEGLSKTQKALFWVGGSLLAVLALFALFLIGTRLSDLLGPAPAIVAPTSASPTPSPTPTAVAIGPVEPGNHEWDELLGGECLDPYPGPWAEQFTVVDCAAPHPAQLVARGTFAEPAATATEPSAPPVEAPASVYPGAAALQAQINLLCTTPKVIDYAAAGKYTDIQFEASYPATDQQWADGDREYYCFVSRKSGEPITGTVAVPQAAPAP
jgi:hypothetical protein